MRIGIDATGLYGPLTGVENYIVNIVDNLLQIDKHNDYIIYFRNDIPRGLEFRNDNATFRPSRFLNRKLFQQTRLPFLIYSDSPDVMFFPGNSLSLVCPCSTVLTIHGLQSFVIPPHMMPKSQRLSRVYWKWMTQIGCAKATKIITVSASTKSEIIGALNIGDDKVDSIHHAAAEHFQEIDRNAARGQLRQFGINDEFVLCVGTLKYKNIDRCIKAFHHVKKQGHTSLKLVIAGSKTEIGDDVFELAKRLEIYSDIIFLDYFAHEDLPLLYSAAEVFLFPSLYEAFGIPILEAFACGTPVITSNITSLPEVAGDAGVLVDPYNWREVATALERVLSDQSLRDLLRRKGHERVKQFSWQQSAVQTLSILEEAGNASKHCH